nr:hypothetical protein [Tanacetum cinerariifolium]
MFHKKNVDFAELIREDFQYQIDYPQSKLRRRKIMSYPRFTKIIINYFLSQYKFVSKRQGTYVNTIKDDGILGRLKFVSKGEDYQEYGLAILDTMLNDDIMNSEAYHTFLALSSGLIPPNKGRGKGSKGKKETVTPKKKILIIADESIIPAPNVVIELEKSISRTEAKIAEEARRVHETHECLVTKNPTSVEQYDESDGEPANSPTGRKRPTGVVIRDTPHVSKKKLLDQSQKLKGIQVMSKEEQLVFGTKKAIKANKEAYKIQEQSACSSEGADGMDKDDHKRSVDIEETGLDNDDKVMDDAKKNDEKVDEEKDPDKVLPQDDKAEDDQQENHIAPFAPLLDVLVSVIPEQPTPPTPTLLEIPLLTPPIISEAPPIATIVPDPLLAAIQRLDDLERKFDVWTKVDHSEAIEALIQANVINEKRCHEDKDEDLTAGSDQGNENKKPRKDTEPSKKSSTSKEFLKGKTLLKTSKSAKSVTAEEPIEEHVHEMTIDVEENIVDDMVNADEQPDEKITKANLVGLVYKLLKGTCQSSIELEYNMEECYKALSDQLNWANPKGDRYTYDLSKSLPLKSRLGYLTVAAEYFFNNDLEYLKLANLERKYTMSITKTMASRPRFNKDMPRRKWSAMDQRRFGIMVNLIDNQLLERRIMWNLERLVGTRELEMDYRLM